MKNKYLDTVGLNYVIQKLKNTFLLKSQFPPIYFDTVENWNAQTHLLSEKNAIYIYTDHKVSDDKPIAGIKFGDGKAYLIDIPFIDANFTEHINDDLIHVSAEDRARWDAKVRCYYAFNQDGNLIFTTD